MLLGSLVGTGAAANLMIDDFLDGDVDVVSFVGSVSNSVAASVTGGIRAVEVNVTAPNLGLVRAQYDTATFIETVLDVASNVSPAIVTLGYDGGGAGLDTLGAGDFGGYTGFEVTFRSLQLATTSMTAAVRLTDADGDSDSVPVLLNSDIAADTAFLFPRASFAANVDFSRLRSIEVIFDTLGNPNIDYQVQSVQAVPEPTAWWLAVLATAGALMRRRRGGGT